MTVGLDVLPAPAEQAERLIDLGLDARSGLVAADVRQAAARAAPGSLLVIHPDRVPPSELVPFLSLDGKAGFVVEDMVDVDQFRPIDVARPPDAGLYLVHDPQRGEEWSNWSPDEALPAILAAGRTPLTLTEGLLWLVQQPTALARNHCFMTVGARRNKPNGAPDSRVPALWISNGTGRDGRDHRDAPKVGWCWAGNRHSWLGFASARTRSLPTPTTP